MMNALQLKAQVLDHLIRSRIVAIIRLPDLTPIVPLCRALVDGGFKSLEITLNSPGALEAIAAVSAALPEVAAGTVAIGAGTVLTGENAHAAIERGARFIISPTIKESVMAACKAAGVVWVPGAFTPNEIETAWDMGADIVKVFPSRAVGPKYLKEIHGPFPDIRLMPTGGIEREMVRDFLAAGAVAVGVGSVLDTEAIALGDWAKISEIARTFVAETIPIPEV